MAVSLEAVLMSMGVHLLSMFWLNSHVKCIIHWASVSCSVSCMVFLFRWSVANSAVCFAYLFGPIFGWQNMNERQLPGCTSMFFEWAQWLQSHVQLNYPDHGIGLQSLCKLGLQIFTRPSCIIYLLVGVSASVFQLWRSLWFSFLFLDLTVEERYGLALFQWEIPWQLETMDSKCGCYYQVPMEMEMLDMHRLRHPCFVQYLCLSCRGQYSSFQMEQAKLPCFRATGNSLILIIVKRKNISNFPIFTDMRMEQSKGSGELIQWLANNHANQHCMIQWDPGGCLFALCSSEKRWTTPLDCYEQLQWSSLWFASAFWIWMVAWNADGLVFSTGNGQAPFQGGRDVIRAAFFDDIHATHEYVTFVDQIHVDYNYYLDQAYYFDTVGGDLIYYHNYHGDINNTEEVDFPWDPGKSALRNPLKLRLGDKPSFKEGGMLLDGGIFSWAGIDRPGPSISIATYIQQEATKTTSRGIRTARRRLPLPPRL